MHNRRGGRDELLSDQPLTTGSTSHLGEADPALKVTTFGEIARRAAGVDHIHRLPGKHFLQEDQSPALAELITAQARP